MPEYGKRFEDKEDILGPYRVGEEVIYVKFDQRGKEISRGIARITNVVAQSRDSEGNITRWKVFIEPAKDRGVFKNIRPLVVDSSGKSVSSRREINRFF